MNNSGNIGSVFEQFALTQPNAPALIASGQHKLTYADLHAQTRYVREKFHLRDFHSDDIVAGVIADRPAMAFALVIMAAFSVEARAPHG